MLLVQSLEDGRDLWPTRNGRSGCCRKEYNRAVIRARAVFSSIPVIRNADIKDDDLLLMAANIDQLGVI